ncbi:hypothetical protein F5X99DRAFT_59097 [Biscogniauxia marginata]|nr:hypothetical protein F5X99DRAFT_59097 [Biscogniauxia marginata]
MESNRYSQTESLLEPLTHINREHLAAMADAAVADQNDFSTTSPSSPSQKRKRGAPDSSPDSRRTKRSAPVTTIPSGTPDAASAAYVETAVEAAQAAAQAATNADFAALQQATVEHRHGSSDPANASSTAAAALGTMYPTLHVPQSTEETFAAQATAESENHSEPSYGHNDILQSDSITETSTGNATQQTSQNGVRPSQSCSAASNPNPKPAVGSEEWHKLRKDNHKEVERRRRETINEGINELAKIVPGCEKNKGSILQRAVAFITQLKENEAQNIEKWTLEKLLTEQAIQELSVSNDKLKQECERAYRELTLWKQAAQNAGLQPPQAKEENTSSS